MTQNLAYDITQERIDNNEINSSNTDLPEGAVWNNSSEYPPVSTRTTTDFSHESFTTSTSSWDLGEWILKDPSSNEICDNIPNGGELNSCERLEKYDNTQDSHYLIGNYYQWGVATAGTSTEDVNQVASGSICPKNWQLPSVDGGIARSAADIANITNYDSKYGKTFTKLFTSYGYTFLAGEIPKISGDFVQLGYNPTMAPLYFTKASEAYPYSGGFLKEIGSYGAYWSNQATSDGGSAFSLSGNIDNLMPSLTGVKVHGFSVRCVAR